MTTKTTIINATITNARLTLDRGVFLCAWLTLELQGGGGVQWGGHVLGEGNAHSNY